MTITDEELEKLAESDSNNHDYPGPELAQNHSYCRGYRACESLNPGRIAMKEALDTGRDIEREFQERKHAWRKVGEEMPGHCVGVLIYTKSEGHWIAYRRKDLSGWFQDDPVPCKWADEDVIAWKPLDFPEWVK